MANPLEAVAAGNFAETLIEAGKKLGHADLRQIGDKPVIVLERNQTIEDLERLLPAPTRIHESITLTEVRSFIDYWQSYADDSSVIFADLEGKKFRAVFDYHTPGEPAWGDHTATLSCRLSTEWKVWAEKNTKPFDQASFAEFIEMNALDIVSPDSAEMVQIALTLQAKTDIDFKSGVRLQNGQIQIAYQENIKGTAGENGQLQIPEKFELGIRVFQGGEKYKVEAYLRYRIREGKLAFFYQLIRPERILEDAFELVKKQVAEGCTGNSLFAVS